MCPASDPRPTPVGRKRRNRRRRASDDGERGAALVEFALILPVLALLIFGIIDFGLTLNDYQAVRQGVREGARDASVLVLPSSCTATTTAAKIACDVEGKIGLGAARTYVKVVPPTPWDKESTVLVCAQARATSMSGFTAPFLETRWLQSKIRVRIEKEDDSVTTTAHEEAVPSGTSWSWCT
jgi:Flp pilus assembly protein TadG